VCTNLLTYSVASVVPAAVPVAAAASTLTIRGASFFNSGALKCRLTSASTGARLFLAVLRGPPFWSRFPPYLAAS
jgi:hypothetical protein